MSSATGMMDPAFFVGKKALLEWVNGFFDIGYTKIEQAASGALYCQIVDAVFPGSVPLHKVNFEAKFDYEFVKNFKVLQDVFNKKRIEKVIPVERLIKARYQDNLEMLQWMKAFFDSRYGGHEYKAAERRAKAKSRRKGKGGRAASKSAAAGSKRSGIPVPGRGENSKSAGTSRIPTPAGGGGKSSSVPSGILKPSKKGSINSNNNRKSSGTPATATARSTKTKAPTTVSSDSKGDSSAKGSNNNIKKGGKHAKSEGNALRELAALHITMGETERTRNFYFEKVCEIEQLCLEEGGGPLVEEVKAALLAVLYEGEEAQPNPTTA